jgi:hypothetical protein
MNKGESALEGRGMRDPGGEGASQCPGKSVSTCDDT